MPIAIAGMHRSGTSMVTRMLRDCGLYLGESSDLIDPASDNPEGFWEHRRFIDLNETLLSVLGGGWDWPPPVADLPESPACTFLRVKASNLIAEFEGHEPWGWKDPRTSIMMPFWVKVCPDLRVVAVVRNPLEVADSLHRRNNSSHALGLALWATYNQRLLDTVQPRNRIITHYHAYFEDPFGQLERVVRFLGLPVTQTVLKKAATPETDLRHARYTDHDLQRAAVSSDVMELYGRLCREAQWSDEGGEEKEASPSASVGMLARATESDSHDREHGSWSESESLGLQQLHRFPDVGRLDRSFKQEETIRSLQQLLDERTAWSQRSARAIESRDETIRRLEAQSRGYEVQLDAIFSTLNEAEKTIALLRPITSRIRQLVNGLIPTRSIVLVASYGDNDLVAFPEHHGWHFPQTEDGVYAGADPVNSETAISHLQELNSKGARYFLMPSTALWWLEYYDGFRRHLDTCHRRIWDDGICRIYQLLDPHQDGSAI